MIRRRAHGVLVSIALLAVCSKISAQPSGSAADAIDPIRCWWLTSAGAVAIGEPFEATLTCAAHDDGTTRVVADQSRLGALAIQLGVFEVLGGSHPPDLRTDRHRFFQYHYTLRVIDRDVIGKDAVFPDINVSYRVHTGSGGDVTEGRERTYVVPGQPLRVLSLVPGAATDIRDSRGESFARVESLQFQARALRLAALALAALGVIAVIPALVALVSRRTGTSDGGMAPLPPSRILSQVAKELEGVEAEARGGWTPDLAARASVALRLAASCALRRHVSRHSAAETPVAGRLIVPTGFVKRRRISAASAITAADVRAAIDRLPLTTPADIRDTLDGLQRALATLTAALYRPSFDADHALSEALAQGRAATSRLRRAHAWPRGLWHARAPNRPAHSERP